MHQQSERAFVHLNFAPCFSKKTLAARTILAKYLRSLSAPGILDRLPIKRDPSAMLYAILCYHDEDAVGSWSKEHDAAVMTKLAVVQDKLTQQGRLAPGARMP